MHSSRFCCPLNLGLCWSSIAGSHVHLPPHQVCHDLQPGQRTQHVQVLGGRAGRGGRCAEHCVYEDKLPACLPRRVRPLLPSILAAAPASTPSPPRSTMFLMGPATQMARMFDSRRWISTAVYLTSLVLTMVSALVFHSVRHRRWRGTGHGVERVRCRSGGRQAPGAGLPACRRQATSAAPRWPGRRHPGIPHLGSSAAALIWLLGPFPSRSCCASCSSSSSSVPWCGTP